MVLMPLLSRLLTLLVILTMPLFLARLTLIPIKSLSICFRVICISITTILKRRGCLTVPRLTLMSLIKMMLVMVFVFFFQAEDGIRDYKVTGVQTCALPILELRVWLLCLMIPKKLNGSTFCASAKRRSWRRCRSEERRVGKECREQL